MTTIKPSGAEADFKADVRKLDYMLKDLREMQTELLPNDSSTKPEDLKNLDKFGKKKLELNNKLKECRDGITRLDDAKRTLSAGQRDMEVIKLLNENSKMLKEATAMWTELKQILLEDEAKKGKKRLDSKVLSDRRKMTKLLGKEIVELTNKNSRTQGPTSNLVKSSTGDLDEEKLDRDARRDQRTAKKREERRQKRDKRRGKRGKGEKDEDELDDMKDVQPMSAQEQAFMEEKDTAYKEQDAVLEEISKGLDELLELGEDMNKNLKVQENMLDELGTKIDNNIENFKNANARLKHLLDESGGLSRWCPMIICFIILIALCGYIFSIVR